MSETYLTYDIIVGYFVFYLLTDIHVIIDRM